MMMTAMFVPTKNSDLQKIVLQRSSSDSKDHFFLSARERSSLQVRGFPLPSVFADIL